MRSPPPGLEAALTDAFASGWLIADNEGANPVLSHILESQVHFSRRAFLLVTPVESRLFISALDIAAVETVPPGPYVVDQYVGPADVRRWMERHLAPLDRVAMEYSRNAELPSMSRVDAGTLDQIRSVGVEVVSSADLFQRLYATWTHEDLDAHNSAMVVAVAAMESAYGLVERRLRDGEECTECDVQRHIVDIFAERGVATEGAPIVAANASSRDPHYDPTSGPDVLIQRGDWLLIDLWCRLPTADGVFADITWVGQAGGEIPRDRLAAFEVVASARDKVVEALMVDDSPSPPRRGFELDRIARSEIDRRGFGPAFVHRTGHALSAGPHVHGLGANLDDLETHDTREIVVGSGFTVEPGVYLADFGVRSEINVYLGQEGPIVTSPCQSLPLVLDV